MGKKKTGFNFEKFMAWEPSEEHTIRAKAELDRLISEGRFALPEWMASLPAHPSENPEYARIMDILDDPKIAQINQILDKAQEQDRRFKSPEFLAWLERERAREDRVRSEASIFAEVFFAYLKEMRESDRLESDAPLPAKRVTKTVALIAELEHEWLSIRADIKEASRNGLKAAAHTGQHGEWDVEKAREWAKKKGKLRAAATTRSSENSPWLGSITRHNI